MLDLLGREGVLQSAIVALTDRLYWSGWQQLLLLAYDS